jgi:hypothetical protein
MNISKHFDKNNLHHAYLIEGARDEIIPEILRFCESLNIKTSNNPDFCSISIDNFKIDEAFDLRSMSSNKSFSSEKKIFMICVNSFSLDAQNVLLKMFEEPIENTHFFLIVPDINTLLKTFISRFYLIINNSVEQDLNKEAGKFLTMPLKNRLDLIKELLIEEENDDEEGNEIIVIDSVRSKSLKFLNSLELVLEKTPKSFSDLKTFEHIFKVREFLRMPGSSTKILMESVALITPNY